MMLPVVVEKDGPLQSDPIEPAEPYCISASVGVVSMLLPP
jgi:hypothetical protein